MEVRITPVRVPSTPTNFFKLKVSTPIAAPKPKVQMPTQFSRCRYQVKWDWMKRADQPLVAVKTVILETVVYSKLAATK